MARCSIFILFFFLCQVTFAQSFPDKQVDLLVKKGISNLIEQNYDEADKVFITLDHAYPNLPFGKLYSASVLITKANDLAIPFESEKIEKYLDEAESIIEKNNDTKSLWSNYFMGMAKGFRAYFTLAQGKWFSTFTNGINAVNYFEDCLKIDSSFSEALIAVGTYKYWKSVKASWLPFFADEKNEGFKLLRLGVEKESYSYTSGVLSLLWIYINQKKSPSAIQLAEDVLKKYPNNRNFKWALARAYEDVNLSKAIEVHYELLASYASTKQANRINEIVLKHRIAQDYERLGEYKKALQLCNEILSMKKFSDYEKEILEERFERVIALSKKMSSMVKEN